MWAIYLFIWFCDLILAQQGLQIETFININGWGKICCSAEGKEVGEGSIFYLKLYI